MSPFEPVLHEEQARSVVEPDLATKLRYRLGWSIPEEHRSWVERDVASRAFPLWQLLYYVVAQALAVWLLSRFVDGFKPWPYLIGGSTGAAAVMIFFADYKRRRLLESYEKRWKRQRERDESPDLRRFP